MVAVVASAAAGIRAASNAHARPTMLQLRAPGIPVRQLESEACALVAASPVPVLVSSRCDVALAAGAAGVNLPERDISVSDARHLLGDRLIGRSVHSVGAALSAQEGGADFVIFGPVWATSTHPSIAPAGVEALARVCRALRAPVIAIGGVTVERIAECQAAGAAGYAAIGLFQ